MYTVTRQCQWPEGTLMVEVSSGGIDYTNPGALGARYAGEFKEFVNPIEAAETAIAIAREWRKDAPGKRITVGYGATGGMTMPFDSTTFKGLLTWAKLAWDKLEKCPNCGEPMPDNEREHWRNENSDWTGQSFCSDRCAERSQEFDDRAGAELNGEEESLEAQD